MKNKKIITSVLVIISLLMIAGVTGIGYLICNPEIVMNYLENYRGTSEKRLLRYLEEKYDRNFPQSMTNIEAGELYTGIDGSSMFILKFQVSAKDSNDFLIQFHKTTENLKPYTPEADGRIGDEYLEWFKSPIEKGLIGNSSLPYIYIDTSNQSEYVIYMEGVYKM